MAVMARAGPAAQSQESGTLPARGSREPLAFRPSCVAFSEKAGNWCRSAVAEICRDFYMGCQWCRRHLLCHSISPCWHLPVRATSRPGGRSMRENRDTMARALKKCCVTNALMIERPEGLGDTKDSYSVTMVEERRRNIRSTWANLLYFSCHV